MKTKLFNTYSRASNSAAAEIIFIGSTGQQAFAHRAGLHDHGDSTIAERAFSWTALDTRTLRVFRLSNGDIGFRAFGSGVGNENIATRIFDNQAAASAYLNSVAQAYINSNKGWTEV